MKLYKTIILAAAALFAVSCSNDPETELELTAENIQVSSVGGTQTFNINCNADWTISVPAAADWLTVNFMLPPISIYLLNTFSSNNRSCTKVENCASLLVDALF